MQKRWVICGAVVLAGVATCSAVNAALIPLIYESGPKTGQAYAGGPLIMDLTVYEVGTLYNSYPVSTTYGYSGAPSFAGVNAGVSALDAQAVSTPAGAQARGAYPGLNGNMEDGWGIVEVNDIKDASGFTLFSPGVKHEQLTGIFYGEQDFYINQSTSTSQSISGAGLQADFFLSPTMNFDPTPGTAGRTPANTYAGATDGSFVMHVSSVPGFINGPGVLGGTATEFESNFDVGDTTGTGAAFADISSSSPEYSVLGTGGFASSYGFGNADLKFNYTDSPAGVSDWLVNASDPIKANAAVPEPVSLGAIALSATALLARRKRR